MLRCINCHLCVDRMLRHVVSSLPSPLQTLLATWRSLQQLPPEALICQECFLRLEHHCKNGNLNAERDVGHAHVCLGCGRSVSETRRRVRYHRVEASDPVIATILLWDIQLEVISSYTFVCRSCWMRAKRQVCKGASRGGPGSNEHADIANQPVDPEQLSVPHQEIPVPPPLPPPLEQQEEESLPAEPEVKNEIKVFCPKCNTEVSHTAEGIQLDQTKIIIAKVYHYFEQEYEELRQKYLGLDLAPLSKFHQRTALAVGVSEQTVVEILKEEARRNDEMQQKQKRSRARKRPREPDSSSEEDSVDNNDEGEEDEEQPSTTEEQPSATDEVQTLMIKEEPPEPYDEEPEIELPDVKNEPGVSGDNKELVDPISIELKTEPQNEEPTTSNETLTVQRATKCYKGRKKQRISEAPPDPSAPPASSAPLASSAPPALSAPPVSSAPSAPPALSAPPVSSAPPARSAPPVSSAPSAPPARSGPPASSAPSSSPAPPRRQLLLLEDGEVKVESIAIEEGFS